MLSKGNFGVLYFRHAVAFQISGLCIFNVEDIGTEFVMVSHVSLSNKHDISIDDLSW